MYSKSKYDILSDENKAYFIVCSVDTQRKIDDFFTINRNFKKIESPIIIDDSICFTLFQYRTSISFSNMLLLSSNGIQIIRNICKDCTSVSQMVANLKVYFSKINLEPKIFDIIKTILPSVARHFDSTKDQLGSPYIDADMTNRCICIFYPIYTMEIRGISIILSRVKFNEKGITKGRISSQ